MKIKKLFGIAALAAVIGFLCAACDDTSSPSTGDTTAPTGLAVKQGTADVAKDATVSIADNNTAGLAFTASAAGTGITYTWEITSGSANVGFSGSTQATATGASVTIVPKAAGNATIKVTAANSKGSINFTFGAAVVSSTTPPSGLAVKQGNDDVGATVFMDVEGTAGLAFSASATGLGITYTWEITAGDAFVGFSGNTGTTATGASVTIVPKAVGSAAIKVTAANGNGSVDVTFTVEVDAAGTEPSNFAVRQGSDDVANDGTVSIDEDNTEGLAFTATANGPGVTYTWTITSGSTYAGFSGSTGTTATGASVTIVPKAAGTAAIKVTAGNANGSIDLTFKVEVTGEVTVSKPTVTATGSGSVTEGSTQVVYLSINNPAGSVGRQFTAQSDGASFTWVALGSASVVRIDDDNTATATIVPLAPGTATISVTAADNGVTSPEFSFTVRVTEYDLLYEWSPALANYGAPVVENNWGTLDPDSGRWLPNNWSGANKPLPGTDGGILSAIGIHMRTGGLFFTPDGMEFAVNDRAEGANADTDPAISRNSGYGRLILGTNSTANVNSAPNTTPSIDPEDWLGQFGSGFDFYTGEPLAKVTIQYSVKFVNTTDPYNQYAGLWREQRLWIFVNVQQTLVTYNEGAAASSNSTPLSPFYLADPPNNNNNLAILGGAGGAEVLFEPDNPANKEWEGQVYTMERYFDSKDILDNPLFAEDNAYNNWAKGTLKNAFLQVCLDQPPAGTGLDIVIKNFKVELVEREE